MKRSDFEFGQYLLRKTAPLLEKIPVQNYPTRGNSGQRGFRAKIYAEAQFQCQIRQEQKLSYRFAKKIVQFGQKLTD